MAERYPALREICDRWVEDAIQTKLSDIPSTVYHYTDATGLHGMLKAGTVWATDFRFLNDKTELVHLAGVVKEYLNSHEARKDQHDESIQQSFLHYLGIDSPFDQYVFSLSTENDDLSQWRGYAREGKGFTIGLSGADLLASTELESSNFAFVKVEYSHKKQLDLIKSAMRDIKKQVLIELGNDDADESDIYNEAGRFLDAALAARATVSKHRSFASEREWRLIAVKDRRENADSPSVRVSGQRLVPFIELRISPDGSARLPIESIGIGPGFTGSEDIHAIKALCKEMGYDPAIYFADTPYRRV